MKLREIFRFEFAYQIRRLRTWLIYAVLAAIAFLQTRGSFLEEALYQDFFLNAPFVIAFITVFGSLTWLLIAATVAGEAGARDAQTGMYPLTYTSPVSKAEYLGGRFLAAFALNGLAFLAVQAGILLAVYAPGVGAEVVGPFRPAAYLTAYAFFALPNAFVGTALQFAWAALGRRAIAGFLGSVLLFSVAYGGMLAVLFLLNRQDLAALFDVFGHVYITSDLVLGWTPIEKNTRLISLEGLLLRSRLIWAGVALGALALTYSRFRFVHHTASPWWGRLARRRKAHAPTPAGGDAAGSVVPAPRVRGAFGFATYTRQTLDLAWASFRTIAKSRGGLVLLAAIAAVALGVLLQNMDNMGTPLLPRTDFVLTFLTAPLTDPLTPWVIIPLLIVFWSGELVWRERDAGLGEITDAAPVPEWVPLLGKFFGLGLLLVACMALLMAAGVLAQLVMGYRDFEVGLYARVLFGLQLPEYLLFAWLALVVQGLVSQKYLGHLAALLAYLSILFASMLLGIEHHLLVYGSGPAWSYTAMRGFGASLGPWLWFKLYWAAWALLLAVAARLFWVRGREPGLRSRLRQARGRLTRPTAALAAAAAGLILTLGGFIFYNTNVLNEYSTAFERAERRAEYERRYARYANVPQPSLTGTSLHVEIYPGGGKVNIRGTYLLVNDGAAPIDSVHLATAGGVETAAVSFDRPAERVLADEVHRHHIYALAPPLQPGDSLRLSFEVNVEPRGFRNDGVNPFISANVTYFRSQDLLPAVGYQSDRELFKPGERRAHGLPERPLIPSLADAGAGQDVTGEAEMAGAERVAFEAVVGTDGGQTAVAPGALRRAWTEGGRRYFHYATDAPIGTEYAFFSAAYAVHEERWNDITIQVYHHPRHAANLDRMLRSVRASLDYYTRAFGPYPHGRIIRLVENPGGGIGAHAEATTIDYTEGFSRFNPADDPRGLDLPFAIVAHEMAHQWGVPYAFAEGAPLLSESFAWYAAMGVVEEAYGREHLRRLLRFFRQPHPIPPIRQSAPLLRAMDPYAAYRKGPFALFALAEYAGEERVNLAFRRLREKHRSGEPPLATSLDLYRELQAVTPDPLRPLLHDLFAANTFWELETELATAKQTEAGAWQVTLRVRARKVTVDPAGVETEVPMDDWAQVGVFAPTAEGAEFGETLYLQMHRVRPGEQTITVTVPRRPADAGIDPYHLLIDLERFDNVEKVKAEG